MIAFVTQTMFGTMKSFVLVVIMVIQMYRTLKEVQCKLSSTTIAKHKSALRSLVAQVGWPKLHGFTLENSYDVGRSENPFSKHDN